MKIKSNDACGLSGKILFILPIHGFDFCYLPPLVTTVNIFDTGVFPQYSTLHTVSARILNGNSEPGTQRRFKELKERIINLLHEDHESFRERFNALKQQRIFTKEYDVLMSEYNPEELSSAIKQYHDFEKRVNHLKNNKNEKLLKNINDNNDLDNQYDELKHDHYEGTNRPFDYLNDSRITHRARRFRYPERPRKKPKEKKHNRPKIFKYLNTAISKIKAKKLTPYVAAYKNNEYELKPSRKNRSTMYHLQNFKLQLSLYSLKLLKMILMVLYYMAQEVYGLVFP
ncbi:hypothetical protein C922_00284 [Plasmodium inui San Antonio 1]|uniref:Uncharacterized protein n=1 Tax=Plasmodium inui San Antonio 1 TaxID=1237626 RepID=W7AVG9_9APIC|nr:hypothetical protein C922_00284 [Plasmodium inui San Antonio 1]EUD69421.1 hypothetical protein C922_00284 [Plasmodium inui San Antonio 1]